jgi:hypothetical protein
MGWVTPTRAVDKGSNNTWITYLILSYEGDEMRVTKSQLRRIIREEKQRITSERRTQRRVRNRLHEMIAPDADAIAQIAGAIKAGEHPEDLAYEHPSARVFSDALLNFDDLYGPEAAAYMDSIEQALTSAGAGSGESQEFVTTLANA